MSGRKLSDHIRSHVWGIVAVFIALCGTAVAANPSEDRGATTSASSAKQVKKLKQKLKGVEQRLAALEGSQGSPPTGSAGGELAGTYPNPTIGTVSGLDLASSTTGAGGIHFGADATLYRQASAFLATEGSFRVGTFLQVTGNTQLGTGPEDELSVFGHMRLPFVGTAGLPPTGDCDNNSEIGRIVFNTADNGLYVCDAAPFAWLLIEA